MLTGTLTTLTALLPLLLAPAPPTAVRHPHFPKKVTMQLGFGQEAASISVSHLTVTFDEAGFEALPAGGTWHLGNGKFETGAELTVGGQKIEKGRYRLLGRKQLGGDWELVLDPNGKDFDNALSDEALALKTRFLKEEPIQEHLRIDLQPSGDQEHTTLQLEVHFDTYLAVADIEVP